MCIHVNIKHQTKNKIGGITSQLYGAYTSHVALCVLFSRVVFVNVYTYRFKKYIIIYLNFVSLYNK